MTSQSWAWRALTSSHYYPGPQQLKFGAWLHPAQHTKAKKIARKVPGLLGGG